MSAIFISHSQKDRKEVDQLEQLLKKAGYTVFRDISALSNGEPIPAELLELIGQVQYFLLCHSQHTQKAPWVNWECGIAAERARTGKLEMKIIRLDRIQPKAHHSLQLYHDFDELFDKDGVEEKKVAVRQILQNRKRFLVIKGSFRIAVAVLSVALVFLTAQVVDQRQNTGSQIALWSQTSGRGDNIGRAINGSLRLTAHSLKRSSDSTIALTLRCMNKGDNAKLYIHAKTRLAKGSAELPIQGLYINNQMVDFQEHSSLLIGENLQNKEWTELKLMFRDVAESTTMKPTLHFYFRKNLYGIGQKLEIKINE